MRSIDFHNPRHYESMFARRPVRSSAPFGWSDLYFERREDDIFETQEHHIDGHYLMVKLNPWSVAERRIDGQWRNEVQQRGATAYVPSGCKHSVRYVRPLGTLCFLTLSPTRVQAVADELNQPSFAGEPRFAQQADQNMLNAVQALDQELAEGNPNGTMFAQSYSQMIAAHLVMGYGRGRQRTPQRQALSLARVRWLDDFITANLERPITLDELAAQVGLSPYYFTRIFKSATGLAPYQYLLHKRIDHAQRCLRRDHASIDDVAKASGFNDATQFAKQFKKITSQTPSMYRQSARIDGAPAPATSPRPLDERPVGAWLLS